MTEVQRKFASLCVKHFKQQVRGTGNPMLVKLIKLLQVEVAKIDSLRWFKIEVLDRCIVTKDPLGLGSYPKNLKEGDDTYTELEQAKEDLETELTSVEDQLAAQVGKLAPLKVKTEQALNTFHKARKAEQRQEEVLERLREQKHQVDAKIKWHTGALASASKNVDAASASKKKGLSPKRTAPSSSQGSASSSAADSARSTTIDETILEKKMDLAQKMLSKQQITQAQYDQTVQAILQQLSSV